MEPTDPPELDESMSEEEARERVEEMRGELEDLDQQRMEEHGATSARQPIQSELGQQWDRLLSPYFKDTPLEEHANRFKNALMSIVPVANIQRGDIPRYLTPLEYFSNGRIYFDEQWIWWKMEGVKIPPYAYTAFRSIYELQLTRAVDATERKLQTQGVPQREKEKEGGGLLDFLRGR